jgi:hypothetical protein
MGCYKKGMRKGEGMPLPSNSFDLRFRRRRVGGISGCLLLLRLLFSTLQYTWNYQCTVARWSMIQLGQLDLAGVNRPRHCPVVKTLKLVIYLFLDFWLQIWFQKYHIRPSNSEFIINKQKIGVGFSLHSLQWGQWGGQSSPSVGLRPFIFWKLPFHSQFGGDFVWHFLTPKISGLFWWILGLKYVLIDMLANDQNELMFFYFQP